MNRKPLRQIWVREDQRSLLKKEAVLQDKSIPDYLDVLLKKDRDEVEEMLRKGFKNLI